MRLVTRSDFDGLACAVLLEEIGLVDDYLFVHPKDVQDGKIEAGPDDVLANVPYVAGCGMWFDHHTSEQERLDIDGSFSFKGVSRPAPSCARNIYDYFGGAEKFQKFEDNGLLPAVDKSDSAQFTISDILEPAGWVLLSFIVDARSNLGRYDGYRISSHRLLRDLIGYCRTEEVDDILAIQDVQERVERYFEQEVAYEKMIRSYSRAEKNVILIDLRSVDELLSGNRFIEYAVYPYQNVSVRVIWGKDRQNVVIAAGHSIIDRSCRTDIGSLMLTYGGGGHPTVGTCQVPVDRADSSIDELVATLIKNG